MATIIGLGKGACALAKKFINYPQYEVYLIDSAVHDHKNFKLIEACKSHEEYEENFPYLGDFFKDVASPCTLIVGGGGTISGSVLRLLEQISHHEISILYIKPDIDLLSDIKQKQERIVFHVLQQYARSNLLKRMFIVSNDSCEKIIGDLTIKDFYDRINELIASTYHMYNVFCNTEPVIQTQGDTIDTARIATFGFIDAEQNENMLYDLKFPREKHYYYSVCKKSFEEKSNLLPEIKQQIRDKLDNKTKVSYSVYRNDYDADYTYGVYYSSFIQEENY